MSLGKIRRGRLELAALILVPVGIFVAISVAEGVYCRRVESEIAMRNARLKMLPEMERRLGQTRECLKRFMTVTDGADGSSELSMRVNRSAQENELATRAVKLDKPAVADGCGWADFRVTMSGEGSLKSLIRFVDEAEQTGTRPIRVASLRMAAASLLPETVYAAEVVLMSRTIQCEKPVKSVVNRGPLVDPDLPGGVGPRIDGLLKLLERRQHEQGGLLSLNRLNSRPPLITGPVEVPPEVPFRLTGIIKNSRRPMALTDQGLLGVGDVQGGFRVLEIRDDAMVVEGQPGNRILLKLYTDEARP